MIESNYFKNPTDSDIQEKILQRFYYFPEIELSDISVLVKEGGDVYLSGRVPSRKIKKKILSEVEKFLGVSKVFDELVVIKKRQKTGYLRSSFQDLGVQ
jgi:osmotically-inducible protein OsmY